MFRVAQHLLRRCNSQTLEISAHNCVRLANNWHWAHGVCIMLVGSVLLLCPFLHLSFTFGRFCLVVVVVVACWVVSVTLCRYTIIAWNYTICLNDELHSLSVGAPAVRCYLLLWTDTTTNSKDFNAHIYTHLFLIFWTLRYDNCLQLQFDFWFFCVAV